MDYTATFAGRFQLRAIKGTSQVVISRLGHQIFLKNNILKLKNGVYRKIVAQLETRGTNLLLKEILEAYE